MCVFITTNLACGHRIRGTLEACAEVATRKPLGPPYDDGRVAYCRTSQQIFTHANACCEACFAQAFLGMTQFACQSCVREMWDIMGGHCCRMLERAGATYGRIDRTWAAAAPDVYWGPAIFVQIAVNAPSGHTVVAQPMSAQQEEERRARMSVVSGEGVRRTRS